MSRPTRADIDLAALRHNYGLARTLSAPGRAMPIVKADAYGHGAAAIAQALADIAPAFGVACFEEAAALRAAGIEKPILLLEGFFGEEELQAAAGAGCWLMIQSEEQLRQVEAARAIPPVQCWLKLDTGMRRLGFPPEHAAELHRRLRDCPQVAGPPVLATHFARADELDSDFTARQLERFTEHARGIDAPRSLANSPALLGWPRTRAEWNRPGFMLYGYPPFPKPHPEANKLRPVMSLRSRILALREVAAGETVGYGGGWTAGRRSIIATVPAGYGDGYPRNMRAGAPVLIRGRRTPLAGAVSMDLLTVDVTDSPDAATGDEVLLWGKELPVGEVAGWAGTIGYELLTRLHARVPRNYLNRD